MHVEPTPQPTLIDASRLVIEAMARAGADAFIGYPITPANHLYRYASERMPMMMPAPDEITTVQWMTGLGITGKIPVTATSFPGYALMVESINMAFMMEIPMVIVLVQRLGPATGTATCGAQGDLLLLRGTISGGHPLPVLATSSFADAWTLSAEAVKLAVRLRTPVVLLTTKEEMMTAKSYDVSTLPPITPTALDTYGGDAPYCTYAVDDPHGVPRFLPAGNDRHQVRYNASTHDPCGLLQHTSPAAMANTRRLENKIRHNLASFTFYDYDPQQGAATLVVAQGICAAAAKDAVMALRLGNKAVSLLIPKTLVPVAPVYFEMMAAYERVVIVEENINGQLAELFFGAQPPAQVRTLGALGRMITPAEIIAEVEA